MSIGTNIRKIRESRNLSQYQLADKIGINQSHIAKIEHNIKNQSIMLIKAFAKELDCSVDDLIETGRT